MNVWSAGKSSPVIKEVHMARKSVGKKKAKTVAPGTAVSRKQVITFRLSSDEAALIAKAADREPLARYSRRAVLAAAEAASKRKK